MIECFFNVIGGNDFNPWINNLNSSIILAEYSVIL